jgi:hypothetical protein
MHKTSYAVSFALLCIASIPALAQQPTQVAPAASAAKGGPLTLKQRQAMAIRAVTRELRPWVPKSDSLKVRTAIVPFNGDERNPITGTGPIEVFVRQDPKDGSKRFIHRLFDKYSTRRFYVNVCPNGQACILDMQSDAPLQKLGRKLGPMRELAGEIVGSKEAVSGILQLASGGLLSQLGSAQNFKQIALISGALAANGLRYIYESAKGRNTARRDAIARTVKWAQDEDAAGRGYPHVTGAYRHYKTVLEETKSGTRPVSLKRFAELLNAQGL